MYLQNPTILMACCNTYLLDLPLHFELKKLVEVTLKSTFSFFSKVLHPLRIRVKIHIYFVRKAGKTV